MTNVLYQIAVLLSWLLLALEGTVAVNGRGKHESAPSMAGFGGTPSFMHELCRKSAAFVACSHLPRPFPSYLKL